MGYFAIRPKNLFVKIKDSLIPVFCEQSKSTSIWVLTNTEYLQSYKLFYTVIINTF